MNPSESQKPRELGLPLAALLAFPLLAGLGEGLIRFTHHRPLGAATWTLLGCLILASLEFFISRSRIGSGVGSARSSRALAALGAVAATALVVRAFILA